jgi:hypothetical protein
MLDVLFRGLAVSLGAKTDVLHAGLTIRDLDLEPHYLKRWMRIHNTPYVSAFEQ